MRGSCAAVKGSTGWQCFGQHCVHTQQDRLPCCERFNAVCVVYVPRRHTTLCHGMPTQSDLLIALILLVLDFLTCIEPSMNICNIASHAPGSSGTSWAFMGQALCFCRSMMMMMQCRCSAGQEAFGTVSLLRQMLRQREDGQFLG